MTIKLEQAEKEKIIYDIFCNVVATGYFERLCECPLNYKAKDYKFARDLLLETRRSLSCEDVWMAMLNHSLTLVFNDLELNWNLINQNIEKSPVKDLVTILDETGDAENGANILQTILFGEIKYC